MDTKNWFKKVLPELALRVNKEEKRKVKSSIHERSQMRKSDSSRIKYDSDEESFSSDNQSDSIIEIGPPTCIKYQAENLKENFMIKNDISEDKQENFPSFFGKELKEYLLGGFDCDFCHSTSKVWPNFLNQEEYNSPDSYCCEEFREYVQALLDYHIYLETLRKRMRFDFRTLTFQTRVDKNKKIVLKNFDEIKGNAKLYSNSLIVKAKNSEKNKRRGTKVDEVDENDNEEDEEVIKELYEHKGRHKREKNSRTDTNITNIDGPSSDDKLRKNQINYFLSSLKYMEKGWTQDLNFQNLGLSFEKDEDLKDRTDSGGYIATTIDLWTTPLPSPILKYYKNGKPFQIILPDRTGNIYYPNGRLALMLSNAGEYYSFMAFNNEKNNTIQIASFDSNGNGFCNYPNGNLRYQINFIGGINYDQTGNCIKRWIFPEETSGGSFQPITFAINEYMSLQIHGRSKIIFNFRSKHGTCRFMIKLKNINKNTDHYDSHFKNVFNDSVFLSLKNRIDLLLQLMEETTQEQVNPKRNPKIIKVKEKILSSSPNLKMKLPRILPSQQTQQIMFQSTERRSSTSTNRSRSFHNSNQSRLNTQNVAMFNQGLTNLNFHKSATNSINFSLHSSSFNQSIPE